MFAKYETPQCRTDSIKYALHVWVCVSSTLFTNNKNIHSLTWPFDSWPHHRPHKEEAPNVKLDQRPSRRPCQWPSQWPCQWPWGRVVGLSGDHLDQEHVNGPQGPDFQTPTKTIFELKKEKRLSEKLANPVAERDTWIPEQNSPACRGCQKSTHVHFHITAPTSVHLEWFFFCSQTSKQAQTTGLLE